MLQGQSIVSKLKKEILLMEEKQKTDSKFDVHVSKDKLPDYIFCRLNKDFRIFHPAAHEQTLFKRKFSPKGFKSKQSLELKLIPEYDMDEFTSREHSAEHETIIGSPKHEYLLTESTTDLAASLDSHKDTNTQPLTILTTVSNSNLSTSNRNQKKIRFKSPIKVEINANVEKKEERSKKKKNSL